MTHRNGKDAKHSYLITLIGEDNPLNYAFNNHVTAHLLPRKGDTVRSPEAEIAGTEVKLINGVRSHRVYVGPPQGEEITHSTGDVTITDYRLRIAPVRVIILDQVTERATINMFGYSLEDLNRRSIIEKDVHVTDITGKLNI